MNIQSIQLRTADLTAFAEELEALGAASYNSISYNDFKHLQKIERYGRAATFLGYATAWIVPNPLTAFCLSLGQFTRWLLMHHISHRGYDKVPGIPKRYTSKYFARGWRRFIDWFDWVHPAAWEYEHNILHHYHTGEDTDPDVAERHTEFLRALRVPYWLKHCVVFLASISWKYTYYAPNTMSCLDPESKKRLRKEHIAYITIKNVFDLRNPHVRKLWSVCYLPYGFFHFILIPACFLPFGTVPAFFVLVNKILAECITNFHSFMVIGPNHTADDLFRFDFHYKNKAEFYITQILGSANYRTGTEFVDYMSIWLNYQIEHHLFPDLPMQKYREIQPAVKALCEKYKIPYKQESIFKRFSRMASVCVGKTSMKTLHEFPLLLDHSEMSNSESRDSTSLSPY